MIFYRADTDFWCRRPAGFEDWSVEAWRNLSSPGWQEDKANSSCFIKNYQYDQVSSWRLPS